MFFVFHSCITTSWKSLNFYAVLVCFSDHKRSGLILHTYCYANGNDIIPFRIKTTRKSYKSMKDKDKEKAMKTNVTSGNEYTIHATLIHRSTTSRREKWIDECANAQTSMCAECTNNVVVTSEFSLRRDHEPSTPRTFIKLFVLDYKRSRQRRQQLVVIQSVLYEDALHVSRTVLVLRCPLCRTKAQVLLLAKMLQA